MKPIIGYALAAAVLLALLVLAWIGWQHFGLQLLLPAGQRC